MRIHDADWTAAVRKLCELRAARKAARLDNVPPAKQVDAPAPPTVLRTIHTELDCWRRLGQRLLDPDDLGWACSQEVRELVRRIQGG